MSYRAIGSFLGKCNTNCSHHTWSMCNRKAPYLKQYVCKNIKAGELFDYSNIKSIRPGYGLHPKYLDEIIGKKCKKDLKIGDALHWKYIEL